VRRLTVLLGVLAALIVAGASPALAVAPMHVSSRITDQVNALKGNESDVSAALDDLEAKTGINEYVVYVSSFDGMNGEQWAQQTAQQSGLGAKDVLLAVAINEKHYGVHVGDSLPADAVDTVVIDQVKPKLSSGDWGGAAIALADGLASVTSGGSSESSSSAASGSGVSSGVLTLLVVVALIAVAGGSYMFFSRSRRRKAALAAAPAKPLAPPDPYAGTPTDQLNYRGSTALLELDEQVRTSQVNTDYARSYFGPEAVPGFDEELAASRDELSKAFTIRQELDDEIPEDEPTTRKMLAELLALTGSASERL